MVFTLHLASKLLKVVVIVSVMAAKGSSVKYLISKKLQQHKTTFSSEIVAAAKCISCLIIPVFQYFELQRCSISSHLTPTNN